MGFVSRSVASPFRFRRAFTLIELLAVLLVLTCLIAMLMPALAKARRHARTVTCLSNLQSLQGAFSQYLHQNFERSFLYDPTHKTFWMDALEPTIAAPDVRLCPEASVPSYGLGSAKSAWGPCDASRGKDSPMSFLGNKSSSYGFNGWLYTAPRLSSAQAPDEAGDGRSLRSRVGRADQVPVFADANWVEGRPLENDPFPADTNAGSAPGESDLGQFCIARHGQAVNVSFLDGHAAMTPLADLRKLSWPSHGPHAAPGIRPR